MKSFLYLLPIFLIFAFGVLYKTSLKTSANLVSSGESYACGDYTNTLGEIDTTARMARWDGVDFEPPQPLLANENDGIQYVLGVASPDERWVEVDLSDQTLKAWDGNVLFAETKISSGLPGTPTPKGEFRVWMKVRATKMEGGQGRLYYYLPNVPYVMFFENAQAPGFRGYGLHGTYWHNDFGTPHSHGCVNLPTDVAKSLYYWTTPVLPEGVNIVRSSSENPGTRIVIHD